MLDQTSSGEKNQESWKHHQHTVPTKILHIPHLLAAPHLDLFLDQMKQKSGRVHLSAQRMQNLEMKFEEIDLDGQ